MNKKETEYFIEEMEHIGDVWEEADVERVYGDKTLEEALKVRKSSMNILADIIGKVINSDNQK